MRRLLLSLCLSVSVSLPCWAGASRSCDGNDVISIVSGLSTSTSAVTMMMWIKGAAQVNNVLWEQNVTQAGGYHFQTITGAACAGKPDSVFFGVSNTGCDNSTGRVFAVTATTDSTWHHIAGTFDDASTTLQIYVDGVLDATNSGVTANPASGNEWHLCSRAGAAGGWVGTVAYLQVFDGVVLTADQIKEVMRHPGSLPTNLSGYLPLWGVNSPEVDLSGNGRTGNLNSTTTESADGPPIFITAPLAWQRWFDRVLDWLVPNVFADDIVVCHPAAAVPNQVTSYRRSEDPVTSGALTNPNALIWSLPPSSMRPWDGIAPAGRPVYWKCVDTNADAVLDDVVEMSQAEQDVLDAPVLAEAARQQAFTDEQSTNDLCAATLAELTDRVNAVRDSVNADIASAATVAQIKTVLTTMNTTYATALKKLGRCIRARAR